IPNVIMLSNVPTVDETEIQKELQCIFSAIKPPVKVQWIQLIRDASSIVDLERKRIRIIRLLELANEEWTNSGVRPTYRARSCKCERCPDCTISCCLVCCTSCCCGDKDAIEQYENELISIERILQTKYAVSLGLKQSNVGEQNVATFKPDELLAPFTGLIFVGFETAEEALQSSILSSRYRGSCWWIENFCKSLGVLIAALFLTSPSYLLMVLNYISTLRLFGPHFSVTVYQWIPAMVLMIVSALVKQMVIASETWTNHVTYGGREKAGQRILFAFLVLTVLILPSLGLGGLPTLLMKYYKSDMLQKLRLECIFSPDSSVLFINYVTTCSLLGSGLLLLQFGRWLSFLCRRCTVHSDAEAELLAQENAGPFPFRERYASMALIQTIVVAFAPLAPIILPFGILYLLIDYLVCSFALVRIYQPGFMGDYTECPSEQNSEDFQSAYHLSWVIQSTYASLTGICLACFYLLCFFALRTRITQLRFVRLGFFALFLLTVFISIILRFTTTKRCLLAISKCILSHSPITNKNRDSSSKESVRTSPIPSVGSSVQASMHIRKAYNPPFVRDLVVST
ncbi:calcium permeable stress-gated cation channel, partial [Paragonimus westermani]